MHIARACNDIHMYWAPGTVSRHSGAETKIETKMISTTYTVIFPMKFVYVTVRVGVEFGINFTSCSQERQRNCMRYSRVQFCHLYCNEWNLSHNFTPTHAITN